MRTDLDHLPLRKRRELERVLAILFEEFEAALKGGTSDYKRQGRILKVILFGSHARGDWVDDKVSGYKSDYDLLVVVSHAKLVELPCWSIAEDRLMQELVITKRFKTPVSLIVHTLGDVNAQLKRGRYFFADIVEQGIALYEGGTYSFASPEPLTADEARQEARGYFDQWFDSAGQFLIQSKEAAARGWNNNAAFLLHQAVERYYHCLLLVLTLYSPPSHNLTFLRSQAEKLDSRLIAVWPRDTKLVRRRFELLKRAYVEARYSKHYKITEEELAWLAEHAEQLQALAEQICRERLAR